MNNRNIDNNYITEISGKLNYMSSENSLVQFKMGIILSLHNIQSGCEHKMKLKSQKQIKEMKHFTKISISR